MQELYDLRKKKLSGLPYNTSALDLIPLIKDLEARACFISQNPQNYNSLTYAYINFESKKKKNYAKTKILRYSKANITLFLSEPDSKICNKCGFPIHLYVSCNKKHIKYNTQRNAVKKV